MNITLTCRQCGSGIHVRPNLSLKEVQCKICLSKQNVFFHKEHLQSHLKRCPSCQETWFYAQKDFNRKIGVILFTIAAVAAIWTYGLSLVALWLIDLSLYKHLDTIAICYKCDGIFRNVLNIDEIPSFDHERNDRTIYVTDHR